MTNRNRLVLEPLVERLQYSIFVLLLDDVGSGRKNAEGRLPFIGLGGEVELEQCTKELRPRLV